MQEWSSIMALPSTILLFDNTQCYSQMATKLKSVRKTQSEEAGNLILWRVDYLGN